MNKSQKTGAVILVLIAAFAVIAMRQPDKADQTSKEWSSYVQEDIGLRVSYPSNWILQDNFTTATSTCCIFIAHWEYSTTTEMNASGTPQTVESAKELIKLQIGTYERGSANDPFSAASTTPVELGDQTFYTASAGVMDFYLLPRNEKTGVGAAIFPYLETPDEDKITARKIVESLKFVENR